MGNAWARPAAAAALFFCAALCFGTVAAADPYTNYLVRNATLGPERVTLRDQAILSLPQGYAFLPGAPARDFMKRLGNTTDANFLGIVLPTNPSTWFVFLEYIPAGYVRDDDAKTWKADDLLAGIRQKTETDNIQRKAQNIPELEIVGWVEKPHYDDATHRLVWSISTRDKGQTGTGINYRTLMLGRDGYVSMVMVTGLNDIQAQKPIANLLLSDLSFDQGKRYSDFNASTDRVAEYGLAALIGGVIVHKLGLFGLIAAFLVKGAKVIGVLFLGAVAAVQRFFRRGKKAAAPAGQPAAPPTIEPQ